jgi:hypothetical protein
MARQTKLTIPPPTVVKRKGSGREIRHLTAGETCQQAIGVIFHDMEVFGLTNGQFSFINVIDHVLRQTGPANLDISTWVAAGFDLKNLRQFLSNSKLKRLRFLVDYSFPNRQPDFFKQLLGDFPDGARVSRVHSKFATITNDEWQIAIRTSMNLNENRRIENFEISDSAELTKYLVDIMDGFFAKPYKPIESRPDTRDTLNNPTVAKYKPSNDFVLDDVVVDEWSA